MDTVIFDLDDTLADTLRATKRANRALFMHFIRTRQFRLVKALVFREHTDFLQSREEILLLDSRGFITRFIRDFVPDMSAQDVERACELYDEAFFPALSLVGGAKEILDYLSGRYRLALVTDGTKQWQERKLSHLGIKDCFASVVISGEVGTSKLNPDNFRMALSGDESAVYVVGDRLETDIRGGNSIGATTILFKNGVFDYERDSPDVPDHTITSLTELKSLL